jgi:hypothetical protein
MSYYDRALGWPKLNVIRRVFAEALAMKPPKGPKQTKDDGNCFFTSVADALNEINDKNGPRLGPRIEKFDASNVKEHLKSILDELEQFYHPQKPLNEAVIETDGVMRVRQVNLTQKDVEHTFKVLKKDLKATANNWQTTKTCQVVADAFNLNIKLLIVYKGKHGVRVANIPFLAAKRFIPETFAVKRKSLRKELFGAVPVSDTVDINLAMFTGVRSAKAGSEMSKMEQLSDIEKCHFMSLLDIPT